MSGPPPGAPEPHPDHVVLLDRAILILESSDLLTKDTLPVMKEALSPLDELINALRHFDPNAYPSGFRKRLDEARYHLASQEAQAALEALRTCRADLSRYWES